MRKILITNDDGIGADGIVRLARTARKFGEVWVVAPDGERSARFVCAIACAWPDGREEVVRGTFEGEIAYEQAGPNGFGYDPIFFVPEYGMTSAEMSPEQKNAVSHRGNALRKMRAILSNETEQV